MTEFKPGCFGSFILHNSVPKVCGACVFKQDCRVEAKANGEAVKQRVAEILKEEPETRLSSSYSIIADAICFDELPVKAQPIAKKLSSSIESIKSFMKNGHAVVCKPEFMMVAINKLSDGFTKRELKEEFIEKFGWSDGTAASHVSMAIPVIEIFGLGKMDSDGVIRAALSV